MVDSHLGRTDQSVVEASSAEKTGAAAMSLTKKLLIGAGVIIWGVVVTTAIRFNIANESRPRAIQSGSSEVAVSTPSTAVTSVADRLKAMDAKINQVALMPLDGKYDPNGYAKLGARVWGVSNDFRRWAALAALQSNGCDYVSAIAVWEGATRSQLSWNVVCSDQRFVISEQQARDAKARFESADPSDDFTKIDTPATSPQHTALTASDAGQICMDATRDRIRHPSSADFSILGSGFKTYGDGTAIFATTFTARNDFNLEIEYQVACDFTGTSLTGVKIVEAR